MVSDDVIAWVERTCAEQGVPVKITDPEVIAKVKALWVKEHELRETE